LAWLDGARGALIDVDGTLLHGDAAIPGGAEALARLRARAIPFRLVTNTTRRSRREVGEALRLVGIDVHADEVLLPAALARRRILDSGRLRALLLVPPGAAEDFEGVVRDDEAPDWVVLGDLGAAFTFEVLNRAFACVRRGAALLALHKNPAWHAGERGFVLDAGAFVAALEYAAGVTAEVVGKPSTEFYRLCLADLGVEPEEVVVVGDDPVNDAGGGAAAGCRTILVRTGKLSDPALANQAFDADLVLESIAQLG
jgi:HAD superfamily hydrolase (TIGR01458 family)